MIKNEAPEKIYVDSPNHDFWYRTKDSNSTEYIRTDVFINKACEWLSNCCITHDEYGVISTHVISTQFDTEEEMLDDFKQFMKGE